MREIRKEVHGLVRKSPRTYEQKSTDTFQDGAQVVAQGAKPLHFEFLSLQANQLLQPLKSMS